MIKTWYNKAHLKKQLFSHIVQGMKKGRRIELILEDRSILQELEDLVLGAGLSPKKLDASSEVHGELRAKLIQGDILLERILERTSSVNKSVFGQATILDLAEVYQNAKRKKTDVYLKGLIDEKLFSFNKEEFWSIRGRLVKGMELFSEELMFMDIHSPLNSTIYIGQEDNSRAVVSKYLDNFLLKSSKLIEAFSAYFQGFKSSVEQEIIEALDSIHDRFYTSCKTWEKYRILPAQAELESLSRDINLWMNDCTVDAKVIQDKSQSTAIYQAIHHAKENIHLQVFKKRRGLNVRNAGDESLVKLETELDTFYKELNGSNILSERKENNAISTWLKFQNLQSTYTLLASTKSILKQGNAYFEWKAFLEECDMKTQHLLETLVHFSKMDWLQMTESWYLGKTLQKLGFANNHVLEKWMEQYEEIQHDTMMDLKTVIELLQASYSDNTIPISITDFASTTPTLDKSDGKEDASLLQIIIPIGKSDKDIQDILGESPIGKTNRIIFHHTAITQFHDSQQFDHSWITSPLKLAEVDHKLQWSKSLAQRIDNARGETRFLFTHHDNIITHVMNHNVHELIESIDSGGIKEMQMGENRTKNITEFFLNDCETGYFIYDQSLMTFRTEAELQEHLELIKGLQAAGYFTIFMDNCRLGDPAYLETLKKTVSQNKLHA